MIEARKNNHILIKGVRKMDTIIVGKLKYKWFWGGLYGSGFKLVSKVFQIGKLKLWRIVVPTHSGFSKEYYKPEGIEELRKHFDVQWEEACDDEHWWYVARSKFDAGYVGTPEDAYHRLQQGFACRTIQKIDPKNKVCCIGYKPAEQKWYGWSHRAIYGFKIGDTVKEGDCIASSGWTDEYLKTHDDPYVLPMGFTAKNESDTKRMAIAFAASVS